MKQFNVTDLQAGLKFSKPVYVDGNNLLVPANVPIRQKDIDRLTKWGISEVTSEGNAVTESSVLEEAAGNVSEIIDMKGNPDHLQLYRTSVTQLDRIFSEVRINRDIERKELDRIIERLANETVQSPKEMVAYVLRSERSEPSYALSAINCLILSVIIGKVLKFDQHRIKTLATAALLHDMGMLKIPEVIVNKKSNLTSDDIKKIRTHTLYSYQIIAKQLRYPEEVGLIALQHHERWDGKGYPRKLAGKNIAVEARIITVADAFEAMVKEKPYRNSMIAHTAMRQLLNDNTHRFDSEILKVFIKSVGIYPLGSFVLLNDGSIGRVILVNGDTLKVSG